MRRLEAGAEAAPAPLAVKATVTNELGLCAALRVALPEEVACWEDVPLMESAGRSAALSELDEGAETEGAGAAEAVPARSVAVLLLPLPLAAALCAPLPLPLPVALAQLK